MSLKSGISFINKSIYDLRAARNSEPFPPAIGPSMSAFAESSPIVPPPCQASRLPVLAVMSSTADEAPPKVAGIIPLYRVAAASDASLKAENRPARCPTLYTGASSYSTAFCADVPPRTWKLLDASLSLFTPASSCIDLMMSFSPNIAGVVVSSFSCNCSAPTCTASTRCRGDCAVTTTSRMVSLRMTTVSATFSPL